VLTAVENVELPLLLTPLSKKARRAHAETALEVVGLLSACITTRGSYPAVRSSGAPSPELSPPIPRSLLPMSPLGTLIRFQPKKCSTSWTGQQIKFGGNLWSVVGIFDSDGSGFDSEAWGDLNQIADAFKRSSFSTVT